MQLVGVARERPGPDQAIGANLIEHVSSVPDLSLTLSAYAQGLFPMDDPDEQHRPLPFYRADPRAIFELDDLPAIRRRVRRSLRHTERFTPDLDRAFGETVAACARPRGGGVWLTQRMAGLYDALHRAGYGHSFELWDGGTLAAGVLGVVIGRAAMLETMFHTVPHAGNVNLVVTLERLQAAGVELVDIQLISDHTRRVGAVEIPARDFERRLSAALRP